MDDYCTDPMARIGDCGLPALLGGKPICTAANFEGGDGGLRSHRGLKPDLVVFTVGSFWGLALRRWRLSLK